MPITDYRTSTTAIEPGHLHSRTFSLLSTLDSPPLPPDASLVKASAYKFSQVQQHVANLIRDKVVVGHSLWNDLSGNAAHAP